MAPFEEPKELASTAPRKRRAAESLDLEALQCHSHFHAVRDSCSIPGKEPATLVPRFRLLLSEEVCPRGHMEMKGCMTVFDQQDHHNVDIM